MPDQLQIRVARLEDAGSIASAEHKTAETRGLLNALPGEAGNQRAIRLYERCGFEVEGRTRRRLKYAEDEYEDDLMMGLLL